MYLVFREKVQEKDEEGDMRKPARSKGEMLKQKEFALTSSGLPHLVCPACGATARLESGQFCPICGKLMSEDYQPLDTIRSAYGFQQKELPIKPVEMETENLFEQEKNSISQTAWACTVYSMVPYLGILFVPFAFITGGAGYLAAQRKPHIGGGRMALISAGLSFVILAVQVFLWWLLYIIPEIGL